MSRARRRSIRAFAWLAALVLPGLGGCILDLDHLTGGRAPDGGGGSGAGATGTTTGTTTETATTTGSATNSGGSGGGGNTCSPLACGACEGACPEGGCPPAVVANGPGVVASPMGIAIAPGALYWVNQAGGSVVRLADDGAAPAVLTTATAPRAIAAGADLVAWTEEGGVWACPPDDCDAKKKLLAAAQAPGSLREVFYDGTTVFWTDRGTADGATDGSVMRCSPADCQPTAIASMQQAPAGLAIAGDTLFWTYQADGFPSGHIYRNPKLGQGSNDHAAGLILPTGLATDDIYVYWTQWSGDGKVLRCPHSQGYCPAADDVMPAAGLLGHPRDVAVLGARVYVSSADDGAIRSCPAPGCAAGEMPRLHAAGRVGLHRMTVGATCVFFTDESRGGSVMKVAR